MSKWLCPNCGYEIETEDFLNICPHCASLMNRVEESWMDQVLRKIAKETGNDFIAERNALGVYNETHLCTSCDHLFELLKDRHWGTAMTTQDWHDCDLAYVSIRETEDNGMGYWVTACNNYVPLDTRKLYGSYIHSDLWKDIAGKRKKEAGYKCQICGSAINLCVHHISYEHLAMEDSYPEDLLVVCRKCHKALHENDLKRKANDDGKIN